MTKTFIVKNQEEQELGEISYSENSFNVEISLIEEKKKIEGLLNKFYREGIRDLGEIILDEPIKSDDPLFLDEVQNQLSLNKGYILIEKK